MAIHYNVDAPHGPDEMSSIVTVSRETLFSLQTQPFHGGYVVPGFVILLQYALSCQSGLQLLWNPSMVATWSPASLSCFNMLCRVNLVCNFFGILLWWLRGPRLRYLASICSVVSIWSATSLESFSLSSWTSAKKNVTHPSMVATWSP